MRGEGKSLSFAITRGKVSFFHCFSKQYSIQTTTISPLYEDFQHFQDSTCAFMLVRLGQVSVGHLPGLELEQVLLEFGPLVAR